MLKTLKARLTQGYRTNKFPYAAPQMPDRFAGLPEIAGTACPAECSLCAEACPTDAVMRSGDSVALDRQMPVLFRVREGVPVENDCVYEAA